MHASRRRALIVGFAFVGSMLVAVRSEAAEATIAAGNYRLELTVMGETMGEDAVVEYKDKTIIIRKPMQKVEYAFQGKIEGDRLTAESKGAGATITLDGKITAADTAEGTAQFATPSGMKIAATFKLKKR